MRIVAVTWSEVVLTIHILAVVVAFGGALAYPVWFRLIRDRTPEQRAFFHGAQATLGKFLITPAMLVVFASGAYLASDLDLWGEGWVWIPAAITGVILLLGFGLLGPSEERLAEPVGGGDEEGYESVLRRIKAGTWLAIALVVAATFMMVARVPNSTDRAEGGGDASDGPGLFAATGCGSCHVLAAAGSDGRVGPDLDQAAAGLSAEEVAAAVRGHPEDFADQLSEEQLDALAGFVAENAGAGGQ